MCGIGGICSSTLTLSERYRLMRRMLAAMAHRGPDGADIYVDDTIAMAYNRLAIIDRMCTSRILWNEDESLGIAFNGEVFNYQEIRNCLKWQHIFKTETDTEVVLHMLEEFGLSGLNILVGDFAFVIWDTKLKRGTLVRDRMGVKPLYYAELPYGFVFASELKAILACFPNLIEIDYKGIYHYLTYRFVPGPQTIFKHIYKLPPGSRILFSANEQPQVEPYWELTHQESPKKSEEEWVDDTRALLEQAICDRLPDEVEFGVLLSGGLDSSLITAVATRFSKSPVRTFSVVFPREFDSELVSEHRASRLVAQQYGTIHTEVSVSPTIFQEVSSKTVAHLEEPIADPAAVLLALLCVHARQSTTVLLSGEGSDELFGGYFIYPELLGQSREYTGMGRLLLDAEKRALFSREFLINIENEDSLELMQSRATHLMQQSWDALHQMLYIDCKYWLVDDLLIKADKMGMMSSMEIRVPYLDHRLVQFAFSIPSNLKLRGLSQKYILRRVAEKYLPKSIIEQPKRGFPLPLGTWLRGSLRGCIEDILASLLVRGYFDVHSFQNLKSQYFTGPMSSRLDHVIWSLVVLELFLEDSCS